MSIVLAWITVAPLSRKHAKEQADALRVQRQECELLKERAIQEANAILSRRLRGEFDKEKKSAISNALDEAVVSWFPTYSSLTLFLLFSFLLLLIARTD